MTPTPAHVELAGISKRFGGVHALRNVTMRIEPGSIHALVGENGAGKSTLGKIVAGVISPDEGEMRTNGERVQFRSPREALAQGATMIAQELSLVPWRSVIANVFLGAEPNRLGLVDRRELRRRYDELRERAGFAVRGNVPVASLSVADQQKVEILRALARDARLIVMDEPTAALTSDEASKLFDIVRSLREQGTTIVYVSHFLDEVLALVDTVTVLRDGQLIRTSAAADETSETLITAMLGRPMELAFPERKSPPAETPVRLSVRNVTRRGVVEDVSFDVRAGEIVGLAGLIGSGRTEVARAIFGADSCEGEIHVDGERVRIRRPPDAIKAGIAMLPESRKDQGLQMLRSITDNVSIVNLSAVGRAGVVSPTKARRQTDALIRRVDVRAARPSARVDTLSGGNQQKVLFAKWLFRQPRILIADEPTRGVDVGAKRSIYELINALADDGLAVVLISSELEEVLGLSDRVLVMRGGRIVAELDRGQATEESVMRAAFGAVGIVA
jgi:simple sugar transport system ATP-binding protein/ribose transport system ATP-binding protein